MWPPLKVSRMRSYPKYITKDPRYIVYRTSLPKLTIQFRRQLFNPEVRKASDNFQVRNTFRACLANQYLPKLFHETHNPKLRKFRNPSEVPPCSEPECSEPEYSEPECSEPESAEPEYSEPRCSEPNHPFQGNPKSRDWKFRTSVVSSPSSYLPNPSFRRFLIRNSLLHCVRGGRLQCLGNEG